MSNQFGNKSYFFIADLHSLSDLFTSKPESQIDPNIRENSYKTLAMLIAIGLDPEKCNIFL